MKKNNILDRIIDFFDLFIHKIFSCKYIYYILFIIGMTIIYFFNYKYKITDENLSFNNSLTKYYIITIIATIVLIIFNNISKKNIEERYLVFALLLGGCYLLLSPVFSQSDESFHFIRAYQVSDGHLVSPVENKEYTDELPVSIFNVLYDDSDKYPEYKQYDDYISERNIDLKSDEKVKSNIRAGSYIFLCYIPQSLGIFVGKIFNLSPYYLGLLAKIFSYIMCTLICYYSLKIIPIGKRTLSLILLTPVFVSYLAAISADPIINSISFLFISHIIKLIHDKTKIDLKTSIILLCLIVFISTCKFAYLPVIGIMILIPYDCFNKKVTKWIYSMSFIIIGIASSMIWMRISGLVINEESTLGLFKYVKFVKAYGLTVANDFISVLENVFAGDYMYQARVHPFRFIPYTLSIIALYSFINEKSNTEVRAISKFIVVCISLLIFTLVYYALFIGNTDIMNSKYIIGVQGRYFIPIILLLIPFMIKKNDNKLSDNTIKIMYDIYLLMNMCVFFTMVNVFI